MHSSYACVLRISYTQFFRNLSQGTRDSKEVKTGKDGAKWLGGAFAADVALSPLTSLQADNFKRDEGI